MVDVPWAGDDAGFRFSDLNSAAGTTSGLIVVGVGVGGAGSVRHFEYIYYTGCRLRWGILYVSGILGWTEWDSLEINCLDTV